MTGLLMPLWGRPGLSERVLAWWSRPSFDFLYRVAIVSPEDTMMPRIPEGWEVVEHENVMQPKWQAGLDAMDGKVDSVMMMGSDDLMTEGLVKMMRVAALERGMACPSSIYWYNEQTGELLHGKYRTVFAGCTYAMDVVRRVKGDLFVDPQHPDRAPDVVSASKIAPLIHDAFRAPTCTDLGEAIVDIKGGQNVWNWDFVARKANRVMRRAPAPPAPEFFSTHFPDFVLSPQTGERHGLQGDSD